MVVKIRNPPLRLSSEEHKKLDIDVEEKKQEEEREMEKRSRKETASYKRGDQDGITSTGMVATLLRNTHSRGQNPGSVPNRD